MLTSSSPAIVQPLRISRETRSFSSPDLLFLRHRPFYLPPPPPPPRLLFPRPSSSATHRRRRLPRPPYFPSAFPHSSPMAGNPITDNVIGEPTSAKKLHAGLRLWEFPDAYVLEPINSAADSYLSVSRSDGSINSIGELPKSASTSIKIRLVHGVIGVVKLLVGAYLLVITDRDCVGFYFGHPIFRVSGFEVLPCDHPLHASSSDQKKMEAEFSDLLTAAKRTPGLYFSYEVNLTLCSQRLHDLRDETKLLPLWRQAEPRFLWNNYLMEALIESKMDQYLLPIIQGSYQNFQAAIGQTIIDVTLIARRCTRRIGTRMWRRGADREGYVANFVETEQILQSNGYMSSFVQIRGSIPLLWEQIVDLTYKPGFQIVKPEEATRIAERHFLDLVKKYGSVLAADLVNTHGSEARLGEKYANAMQAIQSDDIRYVQFDFHQICGHIHFERLSILYNQTEDYVNKHGYFLLNDKGEKIKEQTGVVRTNCIDCLDRTNVTQSMFGRKSIESQLKEIGLFGSDDSISGFANFDANFKILWANHGDDISIQYSGTPALKGDFVRHGTRSMEGIVKDGYNALGRYYYNNFVDGTKQDAIDLLQGHYIVSVSRDIASPKKKGLLETYADPRLAFGLVLTGFMFALISLRQARTDFRHIFVSLIWAGLSIGISALVRANGRVFTNRPRLLMSRH